MRYVDEFRDRRRAGELLDRIRRISTRPVRIMEICGTHTHTIARYGIRAALPATVRLVSGPGCPVCVTSAPDIARIIEFSRRCDVTVATFGDMMRVPGLDSSLQEEKARGGDIRVVYSPLGALETAGKNPDREVVLYAVGFETTAPTVAATVLRAKAEGLKNFSVLSLHKLTPPAMRALLDSGELDLQGFICPGHVTAVIGSDAYAFLADEYGTPCVVAGFEPVDAVYGILRLVEQIEQGRSEIEVGYSRVVSPEGNLRARAVMDEVFETCDAAWRGLGVIPASGLALRDAYADFDAQRRFGLPVNEDDRARCDPPGCACADVLKGLVTPRRCALFGKACTPETPVGPCMVSFEGTCAAYYKYGVAEDSP
ncbi:MAG TPA: hydrogenase formation protein HypD [Deltaproteobacteria bacterium]|nr:hydrogenase formation protein HypD [Deltaproteobacteria bacterium]